MIWDTCMGWGDLGQSCIFKKSKNLLTKAKNKASSTNFTCFRRNSVLSCPFATIKKLNRFQIFPGPEIFGDAL